MVTFTVADGAAAMLLWLWLHAIWICIETVSPEGTFCDTVQVPSRGGDMELI